MKNLLLTFALIAAAPLALFAQTTPAPSDTYEFGNRKVHIPMPDGFKDVSSRFKVITARMQATEDPGNDLLAVGVPDAFVKKLEVAEDIDLEFYTKVSAIKSVRGVDISPTAFAGVVAAIEKNFGSYIERDGPLMKNVELNSEKGLSQLLGEDTKVTLNATKNLGFIDKSDKVFSGMMLVSFEMYGRKMTTLGTVSVVLVNQRLISVFAYRMLPDKTSIRELTDFTKNWTAKIVAANK